MIKVEEAIKIVQKNIKQLETETIDILSAFGRVLGENIYAKMDIFQFDMSAMDGYAVIASDTKGASLSNPKVLKLITEDLPAGYVTKTKLKKGEAMKIMTGALIPKKANAVVILENTRKKNSTIEVFTEVKKGENILKKGEDVKKGELIIQKYKRIRTQEIGMLAALNIEKIKVISAPKVAILSTGDELIEIGMPLKPWNKININSKTLATLVLKYGGIPIDLGIAKDVKKEIQMKILQGLDSDMLVISGGVSVGEYDFVKDVLKDMGMKTKFWRVAMKPGKPTLFGLLPKLNKNNVFIPIFGLPGNPTSAIISFEEFVAPAILKMQGEKKTQCLIINAICNETIKKHLGVRYFLRGIVYKKNGKYFVTPIKSQISAGLKSMVLANGLIIIKENVDIVNKGEEVQVKLFDTYINEPL